MILGTNSKRQINDRLDQSIEVSDRVLLVMADNKELRWILCTCEFYGAKEQ